MASLFAASFLMGLGNGGANPLFYELGAEITYPVPEGTSAGVLVLIWNATSFIVIFLPKGIGLAMNWIFLGLIVFCMVLVASAKEKYLRPANNDSKSLLGA